MIKRIKIIALLFVLVALVAATHRDTTTFLNTVSFGASDSRGGSLNIKANTVSDATDSGVGTQVLTGVIPAGATCISVTCRVTTVIVGAGAASFSLGDGTDADLYGTAIAFAAGTTIDHSDYTAAPATQAYSTSAGDLTMTADAGQFDTGNISCTCYYFDTTAPTG